MTCFLLITVLLSDVAKVDMLVVAIKETFDKFVTKHTRFLVLIA